jgi:PKD repeat protein
MACCSPLDEAAIGMAEVENMDEAIIAVELEHAFEENPVASNVERHPVSSDTEDTLSEGGSGNENSWTYYFGSSTITIGKIKEMVEKGYFPEGGERSPGMETVSEPDDDEAMVYEDFFTAGLCMPPHPALANILLHF